MNTIDNVIRLKETGTLTMIANMRAQTFRNIAVDLNREFYPSEFTTIRGVLRENAGVDITEKRLKNLFKLYPQVAALIGSGNRLDGGEVVLLLNMLANFYLDSEWPVGGDQVEFRNWHDALGVAEAILSPTLDF